MLQNTAILLIFSLLLTGPTGSFAQKRQENPPRILFILDASYSMNRKWENELMWDIAKKTLAEFAATLDKKYGAELALRVYGHNFNVAFNNCQDTKLEVPMEAGNSSKIKQLLSTLQYNGTTPIAYSMSFAPDDFKHIKGKNNIILITDGEESCGGDPCKVSKGLQEHGITLKPVVIGLNITDFGIQNLKCIGDVSNSKTPQELKKNLDNALDKVLDKTTFQINLLDSKSAPTETDVPISIISKSGKNNKNFYHTLNDAGSPDSIYINDLIEFDLKIHTLPPITKSVTLDKFIHNHINIPAEQGFLKVTQEEKSTVPFTVLIRKDNKTICTTKTANTTKLLVGEYDIDVLSLPRLSYKKTSIKGEQIQTIPIPAPGYLYLSKGQIPTGGIFVKQQNKLQKIYTLGSNPVSENISLLPGHYTLIYRVLNAQSVYETKEKSFDIVSGTKISFHL